MAKEVKIDDPELSELISKCLKEEIEKAGTDDIYEEEQEVKEVPTEESSIEDDKPKKKKVKTKKDKPTEFKFSWVKFTLFFIFSFGIGALLYGLYALADKKMKS